METVLLPLFQELDSAEGCDGSLAHFVEKGAPVSVQETCSDVHNAEGLWLQSGTI